MTTPTQAQIEALKKCRFRLFGAGLSTDPLYAEIEAALTAAAEVGFSQQQLEAAWKEMRPATIERCAQVARPILIALLDLHEDELTQQQRSFITDQFERKFAAAIRALKDKPTDPNLQYPGKDPDFVFPEE